MYTYLNQRYGLKKLTLAHAQSIVRAVKQYGDNDFDTLLFGKLLKGSIPEGYRGLVGAVRRGIQDAIKATLGATNAAKVINGKGYVDSASLRRVTSWLS
jgi:hypothetical protein